MSTAFSVLFANMDNNRSSKGKAQLDEYLNSRGLNRKNLSDMTGIATSTIGDWCKGKEPRVSAAVKVSAALDIPLKRFIALLNLEDCPIDRVPDDLSDRDRVHEFADEIMEVVNRYSR